MLRLWLLALTCAVTLRPLTAGAAETFDPVARDNRITLELGAWPAVDGNLFTMRLNGQLRVDPHVVIDFTFPAAAGHIFGDPESHADIGNLTLGLRGVGVLRVPGHTSVALWGGASVSAPTTWSVPATNEAVGTASVLALAAAAHGGYGLNDFLPEFGFARLCFGVEAGFEHWLRNRVEVAVLFAVPLGTDVRGAPVTANIEAYDEVEARPWRDGGLGLRVQIAGGATLGLGTVGFEPFLAYEPVGSLFVGRLGFLISGLGVAAVPYDSNQAETVLLQLGVRF
jgi:hypothetical protein